LAKRNAERALPSMRGASLAGQFKYQTDTNALLTGLYTLNSAFPEHMNNGVQDTR